MDKVTHNAAEILETLRRGTPLVQIITNYVTINDVANGLLCLGASPAMVEAENEVRSFLPLVQALYINLGTLTAEQGRAIRALLPLAKELGLPVLLDPVACGVMKEKMDFTLSILDSGCVGIIKGNTAEIMSLAGKSGQARGVDALASNDEARAEAEARDACALLAARYACTAVATGARDIMSDGRESLRLSGGSALLARFSGSGCVLGGLMAACAGARAKTADSYLQAALAAAAVMKCASEAAAPGAKGPMSFKIALLDALAAVTPQNLREWTEKNCAVL
ncbi:MAG: hydroxyethylthiazole kinase [Spirochaetota bacterium]|jgi:hydroxyethylthiazole kinase|nr:hydroxyethylthiazole kinase [Spirochaetota bacterium]